MTITRPISFDLGDARAAHGHVYDVEVHNGDEWLPHGQLAVLSDAITINGTHVHTIGYHGANHVITLRGTTDDPSFRARLNLTDDGSAFVGTMTSGEGVTQGIRGVELEQVYTTKRHLKADKEAPFRDWENFTIKTEWVDGELKVTYLLGQDDLSNRVRVTKVDRQKGETTLEMVPEFDPPFTQNAFVIVLASGSRTFSGVYTDDNSVEYNWIGQTAPALAEARAKVFRAADESRHTIAASAAPTSTLSFQDLDNISSIEIVTDGKGNQVTVDYAQTTCGTYFNECLVNGLEDRWVDGIYGHRYGLPGKVNDIFNANKPFFQGKSVLGTGQMLYDTLGTNETYKHLIKRIDAETMKTAWQNMGKSDTLGPAYQQVSNDLYVQGYRDGVNGIKPYLDDNPEKWAEGYFGWLTEIPQLITWQTQVASGEFKNVKTRMYEWYVKLQVLAPDKDYAKRFLTISYSALLGVNYSKSQWDDDLKPFLVALIENAIAGKVDPNVMDEVQRQAFLENQELLKTLITTTDTVIDLVDGIAAALTAYTLKQSLQQAARDGEVQRLIGNNLGGQQYEAWSALTRGGKAGGLLSTLFYGASAGFLIYTIAEDAKQPQTPKQILEEVNLGVLSLAILVKGIQKMMSIGVGRFLENFAANAQGAFRSFAGDLALWFKEGGKVVPVGKAGKAFVAIFGESSAEFMARRLGPAMAVLGLVLSSFMLYDAIKSGDVRSIIFEAINTFLALATVVLIGLELLSVGWAGPVGLAIAAVGVIILLVQFIWNLIDPPKPPPDPITEFVNGPMVAQSFAHAT